MILSKATTNYLALVLDSCLHVFCHNFGSSSNDSEVVSIDINVRIDSISWSPCQNFVLLALNNGHAQLVHIPTRRPLPPFPLLDSKKILHPHSKSYDNKVSQKFKAAWIEEVVENGLFALLLLASNGVVSRDLLFSFIQRGKSFSRKIPFEVSIMHSFQYRLIV